MLVQLHYRSGWPAFLLLYGILLMSLGIRSKLEWFLCTLRLPKVCLSADGVLLSRYVFVCHNDIRIDI